MDLQFYRAFPTGGRKRNRRRPDSAGGEGDRPAVNSLSRVRGKINQRAVCRGSCREERPRAQARERIAPEGLAASLIKGPRVSPRAVLRGYVGATASLGTTYRCHASRVIRFLLYYRNARCLPETKRGY